MFVKQKIIVSTILVSMGILLYSVSGFISYMSYERHLKNSVSEIRNGMSEEEVIDLLGYPDDSTINQHFRTLYWSPEARKGLLQSLVSRATTKGHFTISIAFGPDNKVRNIWLGVN